MILKSSGAAAASVAGHRHECGALATSTAAPASGGGVGGEFARRAPRRVPLVELNEHLTCFLCKGYFVDATTIIECLHSFCRSCIVKYLESNKYCPVCDVQVHKTKPLLNIRPDKILQDIVYKLVPRLFQNEVQRRHDFYAAHPDSKPSPLETRGESAYQHLLAPDEMLCVSLTYDGASEECPPRYLRCSAAVSVSHLQKLIRNKYDLSAHHRVDVLHQEDALSSYLTLIDVAYIHQWRRKGPLALTYRIYENVNQHRPSAENNNDASGGEEGWKEVQLRISENGEMSVTGIQDCLSLLDANILQDDKDSTEARTDKADAAKGSPSKKLKVESKPATRDPKRETRSALQALQAKNTADVKKPTEKISKERKRKSLESADEKPTKDAVDCKKTKLDELQSALPACISITPKPTTPPVVLNHTLGLQNLSNNHPLKKHSLASTKTHLNTATTLTPSTYHQQQKAAKAEKEKHVEAAAIPSQGSSATGAAAAAPSTLKVSTVSSAASAVKSTAGQVSRTATTSSTYTSSHALKNHQQAAPQHYYPKAYTPPSTNYTPINVPSVASRQRQQYLPQQPQHQRFKPPQDMSGKWNQAQVRPEVRAQTPPPPSPAQPGSANDLRSVRPAKFFKMRNNMPRYLGCPASGVKPMYPAQEHPAEDDKDAKEKERKDAAPKSVKDLTRSVKEKEATPSKKDDKKPTTSTEIKRHSIVKIDPKTLKPIAERAPDPTSLSYNQKPPPKDAGQPPTPANSSSPSIPSAQQQDLKINTSSVSIFNPIKLQAERKSPHSPIGKRPTSSPTTPSQSCHNNNNSASASAAGASQMSPTMMIPPPPGAHPGKHAPPPPSQKASLGYTPSNPFVPNLQAPTISPSQFMYPSPAGFPYDPMMAAFLAYSRAPFNYDFHKLQVPPYGVQPLVMMGQPQTVSPQGVATQKKKELKDSASAKDREKTPSRASPKVEREKESPKVLPDDKVRSSGSKDPKEAKANSSAASTPPTTTTAKSNKSEKSLQNALDKLTKAKLGDVGEAKCPKGDAKQENVEKAENEKAKDKDKDKNCATPKSLTQNSQTTTRPNKIEIKSQITITPQGNISSTGTTSEKVKNDEGATGKQPEKEVKVAEAPTTLNNNQKDEVKDAKVDQDVAKVEATPDKPQVKSAVVEEKENVSKSDKIVDEAKTKEATVSGDAEKAVKKCAEEKEDATTSETTKVEAAAEKSDEKKEEKCDGDKAQLTDVADKDSPSSSAEGADAKAVPVSDAANAKNDKAKCTLN